MGRKIPGKKHRSVKDPYAQRRQRFAPLKNKVNNPPPKGKEDEQEMPKSVLRIMQLKEKAKRIEENKGIEKPIRQKVFHEYKSIHKARFDVDRALGYDPILPGMERPDRYIPNLAQYRGETLQSVVQRIDRTAKDMLQEIKFEESYKVEINRNHYGEITNIKRDKKEKRSKKPKLSQKRKSREEKKLAGKGVEMDFPKMDTFEFGDIVHAPPENLTLPARKGKEAVGRKPGKTDLLLKKVLSTEKSEVAKKKPTTLEKQRSEALRVAAVEAFRQVKKNNRNR